MEPKVFIIILNWNGKKDTIECLNSLNSITYSDYKILVVDNASRDNSIDLITKKFPSIEVIKNKINLGFAGGMNAGIKYAIKSNPKYILLLNQDTIVDKKFLNKMVDLAESNSKIGIVGPKIYFYNSDKKLWAFGLRLVEGRAWGMKIPYFGTILMGCGEIDNKQYNYLREVESIPGCCMLIKTELIRTIGLLDDSFFLIHEDDDYCLRARETGYKVYVTVESIIWHKISTSFRLFSEKIDEYSESEPKIIYYQYRNWLWILKKHFEKKVLAKVFITYIFKLFPSNIYKLFRKRKLNFDIIHSYLSAFRDGILYRKSLLH